MENKISCGSIVVIAITLSAIIWLIYNYSTLDEQAAKFEKDRAVADSIKNSDKLKKRYDFNIDSLIP